MYNKFNSAKQWYFLQSNISTGKLTFGTWLMVNTWGSLMRLSIVEEGSSNYKMKRPAAIYRASSWFPVNALDFPSVFPSIIVSHSPVPISGCFYKTSLSAPMGVNSFKMTFWIYKSFIHKAVIWKSASKQHITSHIKMKKCVAV